MNLKETIRENAVDERAFWVTLEWRLCGEFAGMPERRLRYWWCDGLVPESYLVDASVPRIVGRAWICNGPKQELWGFTLFLDKPVASREQIDWQALIPPNEVTHWIALDEKRKHIQIEPSAAVPDSSISN